MLHIITINGELVWSRGYSVTILGLDEDKIRKYVEWQEKRDKEIERKQLRLFD